MAHRLLSNALTKTTTYKSVTHVTLILRDKNRIKTAATTSVAATAAEAAEAAAAAATAAAAGAAAVAAAAGAGRC